MNCTLLSALLLAATAVPAPVEAEFLSNRVPVTVVASGGFCDHPPDEYVPAPEAEGGRYEHNFRGFDYVVRGDRFPAQVALGIGVRVRIKGYGPGRPIRVLIQPPEGRSGSWDQKIGQDGELEFGRLPALGDALPEGRYLLSVIDEGRFLFTFVLTLDGVAEDSLCVPVS